MRVLSRVPLFADLSEKDLADIDRRMLSLAWPERELLYSEGQPGDFLYVLASGQAKAYRTSPEGQEVVVDLLAPGDLFGGLPTLGRPLYAETVESLTTVCALRIDVRAFRDVLEEFPAVALRALDDIATQLAQARTTQVEHVSSPVPERVASTLLRLAEKFGEDRSEGVLIQLPLSRADLASMTGSTTESVSRAMSRLRKEGIIDSGRRWTRILDQDRLEELTGRPG